MKADEHQFTPTQRRDSLYSAIIVGIAALTLFIVGAYKAQKTVGNPGKSGFDLALIATMSALAGYQVSHTLKIPEAY